MRAFAMFVCSATVACSFCRVSEPLELDATGLLNVLLLEGEEDEDLSEPLLLLPPPKKPPNDMMDVVLLCFVLVFGFIGGSEEGISGEWYKRGLRFFVRVWWKCVC